MSEWWLSSRRMTVVVEERDGLVVDAAPIVRKFIGQPLESLTRWMRQQGGYREHRLPVPKEQAMSRKCDYCGGPIPEVKPAQTRYCTIECCDKEHRLRAKQVLFDDGWNAAIEAAAVHAKKYPFNDFGEPAKGILELKPPKVKINART